jgi:cell wall-associated NlpC family hydrolase
VPGGYINDGEAAIALPFRSCCISRGFPVVPDRWFFRLPDRVAALHAEIESWRNTPFAPGAQVKGEGGGADCAGFDQAVLAALGAIPQNLQFPRDETDYQPSLHKKVLRYLRGSIADDPQSRRLAQIFAELPAPAKECISTFRFHYIDPVLMAGDLLIISWSGWWHMPIMLDHHRFAHCAAPLGVGHGDLCDPSFNARIKAVFRARDLGNNTDTQWA